MRALSFDPRRAVRAMHGRLGSWRNLAAFLDCGISPRALCTCANGRRRLSVNAENALRRRLRMPPRRVREIAKMRTEDLRWLVENRVEYGNRG